MPQNVEPLENLVDQFARFPGIGRKGATRMAYEVMSMSNEQAMELAKAIERAKKIFIVAESVRIIRQGKSAKSALRPNVTAVLSVWWKVRGISSPLSVPMNTTDCTMFCMV